MSEPIKEFDLDASLGEIDVILRRLRFKVGSVRHNLQGYIHPCHGAMRRIATMLEAVTLNLDDAIQIAVTLDTPEEK